MNTPQDRVNLYRRLLRRAKAELCQAGRFPSDVAKEALRPQAGERLFPDEQLALLKSDGVAWNTWYSKSNVVADLREADLRGAYLRDIFLRGADLRGADLRGADLRDANLVEVDLREARLSGADLRGARLDNADLRGANLTAAKVTKKQLSSAIRRARR